MLMDFDKEVAITTCCNLSIEVEMFTRNSRKQMVPRDSFTEEVSFEWSEDRFHQRTQKLELCYMTIGATIFLLFICK